MISVFFSVPFGVPFAMCCHVCFCFMKCIISFSSIDEAFGLQRHGTVTKLCISLQTHYELDIEEEEKNVI